MSAMIVRIIIIITIIIIMLMMMMRMTTKLNYRHAVNIVAVKLDHVWKVSFLPRHFQQVIFFVTNKQMCTKLHMYICFIYIYIILLADGISQIISLV